MEKRQFPRFNCLVDVAISKVENNLRQKLSVSKNISEGGICLISFEPLNPNEIVQLDICHVNGGQIKVNGRVAWVKEIIIGDPEKGRRFDVGVEFIELQEEVKARINDLLFFIKKGS